MADGFGQMLGALILERREAGGYTQRELAEQSFPDLEDTDGKERRIRELESGQVTRPQAKNYQPICETLSIDRATIRALKARAADAAAQADSEVGDVIRDKGSAEAALDHPEGLTRDELELLATRFGVADAADRGDTALREVLAAKAQEYRAYRDEIERIDGRTRGLGNLKAAARDAAERLDLEEVEALLSRVHAVEKEIAAETGELRARNALLRGRAEDAYRFFCDAADSFALTDPLEPARRRILSYFEELWRHGLRYGGPGLVLSREMLDPVLDDRLKAADAWLWAAGKNAMAIVLSDQGKRTGGAAGASLLAEAVAAYRAALTIYTSDAHPVDWAGTQNNLGNALSDQGTRTGGAAGAGLLAEAVAAYRAALAVRTRDAHPVDWAMTQNNLGAALSDQGTRTGGAAGASLLAEAVAAYRAALTIYTSDAHPVDWAGTQNNLGNALSDQGTRTGGAAGAGLLAEAVTAYRAALTVRTRDAHPVHWATTLNNLGIALSQQGIRTGGAEGAGLLAEAVTAYRAALTIRTRDAHPVDWAMTQNNLGNALSDQGTRTGGVEGADLLAEAVAAYRAALTIHTSDAHPVDWAMTQENLAIAEQALADHPATADPGPHLAAALRHVAAALEVYDPEHMPYDHGTATALHDRLTARLADGAA